MKTANEIIDELGGTNAVASIVGLTAGAVSQWRRSKNGIPKPWMRFFLLKYPKVFLDISAKK